MHTFRLISTIYCINSDNNCVVFQILLKNVLSSYSICKSDGLNKEHPSSPFHQERSSPSVSWKIHSSVPWKDINAVVSFETYGDAIIHLMSCSFHSLFPCCHFVFLQLFCTFCLLSIHVMCSHSFAFQLNNNPSVCKCVQRYFWTLKGHKALCSLLLSLVPCTPTIWHGEGAYGKYNMC